MRYQAKWIYNNHLLAIAVNLILQDSWIPIGGCNLIFMNLGHATKDDFTNSNNLQASLIITHDGSHVNYFPASCCTLKEALAVCAHYGAATPPMLLRYVNNVHWEVSRVANWTQYRQTLLQAQTTLNWHCDSNSPSSYTIWRRDIHVDHTGTCVPAQDE